MTDAVAKIEPAKPVSTYTREQVDLIKSTLCPNGITDQEFGLFLEVAKRTGLDPFQRQIHAIHRFQGQGPDRVRRLVIQTSIDGYRAIAQRHGLAGVDDAVFSYRGRNQTGSHPETATITVYRRVGTFRDPYTATARWSEYAPSPSSRGAFMWTKMPHTMLAKCAEALALRKGFQEVGGVYTDDEMAQSDRPEPEAGVIEAEDPAPPKLRTLGELSELAGYGDLEGARADYADANDGVIPENKELYYWLERRVSEDPNGG